MTAKTTQLAENLSLEEFGSDETQLAREIAGRIQQLHNSDNNPKATGAEPAKSAKTAVQRMTFNPLHPSMELPPEQLIRLMSMHAQQITIEARKHRMKNKQAAATETLHDKPAAPGLLELEYSDEYETPRTYKRLAIAILALAGFSGYPVLKYLADKPASVATEQPLTTQTLPAQDAAPMPEQLTPEPATKPRPKKSVAAIQALDPEPLPIAAVPAEIKAAPDESASNQSPSEIPVTEERPATETPPVIEDTLDMSSDDVLATEPESGIQVTPGLMADFPEDKSAMIDSLESDATTPESATITADTAQTEDASEIEVTNTIDIETTALPTPEIHENAFPDENL